MISKQKNLFKIKNRYYDYGAKPFCGSGTITLIVLTLFFWIPGVIVALGFLIFNEIIYREDGKVNENRINFLQKLVILYLDMMK